MMKRSHSARYKPRECERYINIYEKYTRNHIRNCAGELPKDKHFGQNTQSMGSSSPETKGRPQKDEDADPEGQPAPSYDRRNAKSELRGDEESDRAREERPPNIYTIVNLSSQETLGDRACRTR